MKWLTRTLAVLLALAALLALAPRVLPLDAYRVRLEKELSAALAQPVSIRKLEASLLPRPHARALEVTIGAAEVKAEYVDIEPDVWSLFGLPTRVRAVDLYNVMLSPQSLGGLFALMQISAGDSSFRVERVGVRNATVSITGRNFGPFDADVSLREKPEEREATLETRDRALAVRVRPRADRLAVEVSAHDWKAPIGGGVHIVKLELKGLASRSAVDISDAQAQLYGGSARAKATLTWNKTFALKAQFEMNQVDLAQLTAGAAGRVHLSGRVDAKGTLAMAATTPASLAQNVRFDSAFNVRAGVLQGVDLTDTSALMLGVSAGGNTPFDRLSGKLVAQGRTYRFTDLELAAADLQGRGFLVVEPSKGLSGRLNASVQGANARAAIPMIVGGTLHAPTLQPDPRVLSEAIAVDGAARKRLREFARELLSKRRT